MKENVPYLVLDQNYDIVSYYNNIDKLYKMLFLPDFFKKLLDNHKPEELEFPVIKSISHRGLLSIKLLFTWDNNSVNCFVIESEHVVPGHAAMSAQLREPVSDIFALIPAIANSINKDTPDRAITYLEEVYRSSYKLLRNITNIGIMDKISVFETFDTVLIDFSSFLKNLTDSVKTVIQDINISCNTDSRILIKANKHLLSVALLNLISNSIIYKQDEAVFIDIQLVQRDNNIIFTYKDNSKGIKEQHQQHVFEPYYTRDPYSDGGINNRLGLGLTITKAAFKQAGGNILLTSSFGEGVKYTVSIPTTDFETVIFESNVSEYLLNRYSDIFVQLCDCCTLPQIR